MLMSGARRTTRRGRVVPRRRILRVLNPLSGRRLQVGGARYNALIAQGGPLRRVRNQLAIDYGESIRITHIFDPSDGSILERDSLVLVPVPNRAMVRNVVEGGEDFFRRMADWVADTWVPQLGHYVARFEYGPREWTRVEPGPNGELVEIPAVARMQDRAGVVRFLRQRGIRSDQPLLLPFVNVDENAGGTEGQCIQRFLGHPLVDPSDTSVRGILATAERCAISVRLVDLMSQTLGEYIVPGAKTLTGLIYNHHVYPLLDGDERLVLNHGIGPDYQGIPQMHERLNECNYMMYRVNHTYFTPEGKCKMAGQSVIYEDWMDGLMKATPPLLGYDDQTIAILKRGTIGLYYSERPAGEILNPDDYIAIDMSKCYYNVLLRQVEEQQLPTLSLYDRFEEVPFHRQRDLHAVGRHDVLMIDDDWSRYGFQTNLINGKAYETWIDYGKPMPRVTGILRLRTMEAGSMRKMLKELLTYDEEKQKKYALVNGIFGKLAATTEKWVEVPDETEQQYYEETHDFIYRGDGLMSKTDVRPFVNSRFHVYMAVVNMANATVLGQMLHVQKEAAGAGLPAKIKIDSLTYERRKLRTPFDPTGRRALRRYVVGGLWHFEALRDDLPLVRAMNRRHFTPSSMRSEYLDYSRNTTFIGPPGVGKTYQAMRLNPDLKVCFSNKGARRIGGITIDAALGMPPGAREISWEREQIAGKTVFVDEAQALRPLHWGILRFAYLELGTTFIFALDPDQIPPVEHEKFPVSEHPFWGNVVRLTEDHRNAPCLVAAREALLMGEFEPDLVSEDEWQPTLINIAYTHRTCNRVNETIVKMLGKQWLDEGRYIVHKEHRSSGTFKGEIVFRDGHGAWHRASQDGPVIEKPWKDASAKSYVKWAYCVTIHSTIGETFTYPYTIWDVGHPCFSTRLMYTALTRGISLDQIQFREYEPPRRV